jgi:outer membrane protein OmpA-like peptidoglycan-associated protein
VVFDNPEKTTLSESEKSHLDSVADIMKRYPSLHLSAIGRSYSAGTDKENSRIALARARAVVKYLRSKGIDPERMGSHSIGSDELIPDVNANKSAVTVYLFLF